MTWWCGQGERVGTPDVLPFAVTATRYEDIPPPLATLVDTVVPVSPLRERPEDVLPLAHHVARRARGRDVTITPAAVRGLRSHAWPGNVAELARVIRTPSCGGTCSTWPTCPRTCLQAGARTGSRIEPFERDEIVAGAGRPSADHGEAARASE